MRYNLFGFWSRRYDVIDKSKPIDLIRNIVSNISLPNKIYIKLHERPIAVQICCDDDVCNVTGTPGYAWQGRRWLIEADAGEADIVRTCFAAFMLAIEHEMREKFKYEGRAVFGPHFELRR